MSVSMLVMDMDGLKGINDQHGHSAGDIALQGVAEILRACFRADDVVARIGGDEFAVLLPGLNLDFAQKAKVRVQDALNKYNQGVGAPQPLSLSIGCAAAEGSEPLAAAFKRADSAMYADKKAKKNAAPHSAK